MQQNRMVHRLAEKEERRKKEREKKDEAYKHNCTNESMF